MTFRGSLPSGQAFNGQQQYLPQGGYAPMYGNGQDQYVEAGFIDPSALQQPPPMHYGNNLGGLGSMSGIGSVGSVGNVGNIGNSSGQSFLPQFDELYPQQPVYDAPMPMQQFQSQSFAHPLPASAQAPEPVRAPAPPTAPAPAPAPVQMETYPQTIQPSELQLNPRPMQYGQPMMGGINGVPATAFEAPAAPPQPAQPSPQASVAKSPALSQKSPGIVKKSPSVATKPRPFDTYPVLVLIGEECIQKAHDAAQSVAITLDPDRVTEYQRLISMGLHCLESAIESNKLNPRQEAKARLRYATLLCQETENLMEAETTLGKGIALCDQHRYLDLKYCMQYLLLKVLFQRTPKAALKASDKYISDATAFKHTHWTYAFRFLKASLYVQSGSPSDPAALENLKSIKALATERGDSAIIVYTALLEALILLKTMREDTVTRVQTCIAQASKFQHDKHTQITQLSVLRGLVDLSCSMHEKTPETMVTKLRVLQRHLEEAQNQTAWGESGSEVLLPIRKHQGSPRTISEDSAAILRPGAAENSHDYLAISFITKHELHALSFTFSGVATWFRPNVMEHRSLQVWEAALNPLTDGKTILDVKGAKKLPPSSLREAIQKENRRREIYSYLQVLIGMYAATNSDWERVSQCLKNLDTAVTASVHESIRLLALYLTGVYHQGTANIKAAMAIFSDPKFAVKENETGAIRSAELDVSLLAALNRLWIMQHPAYRDDRATAALLDELRPLCCEHHDPDMRSAFHLVEVTVHTEPALSMAQIKSHIQIALTSSKRTGNLLFQAIALNIMRQRLFNNVVGEQALKSAKAAAGQAKKAGNLLWMSVAEGMLSNTHGSMRQKVEEEEMQRSAIRCANHAHTGVRIRID